MAELCHTMLSRRSGEPAKSGRRISTRCRPSTHEICGTKAAARLPDPAETKPAEGSQPILIGHGLSLNRASCRELRTALRSGFSLGGPSRSTRTQHIRCQPFQTRDPLHFRGAAQPMRKLQPVGICFSLVLMAQARLASELGLKWTRLTKPACSESPRRNRCLCLTRRRQWLST